MAPERLKTRLPILTSEDLLNLAYDLRKLGFNIDTRHYIDIHRVEDLLLGIEVNNELDDIERIKTILGPIFCSTPEEQVTFYSYFDNWVQRHIEIKNRYDEAVDKHDDFEDGSSFFRKFFANKRRVFGLVLLVLYFGIAGYFLIEKIILETEVPNTWLQGTIIDSKSKKPINGAKLNFSEQLTSSGDSGSFAFQEFEYFTYGDLIVSHPDYLSRKFNNTYTGNHENSRTYSLWKKISGPQYVSLQILDDNNNSSIPGARISFLSDTLETDDLGKASFSYAQKDSLVQFRIDHDDYIIKTKEFNLYGYDTALISVSLEKKLSVQADSLKALIARVNNLRLVEQESGFKRFYRENYTTILLGCSLLPLIFFMVWLFFRWYRKPLMLERESSRESTGVNSIIVEYLSESIFRNAKFRKVIQQFRQFRESSGTELDTEATIKKTIDSGGFFNAVYRSRYVLPEYLVLIDQASYDDQQTKFIIELINRFIKYGVFIDRFYFKSDPRFVRPEKGNKPQVSLKELLTQHPKHRLLVFTDASGFFNSITGEPQAWLDNLLQWSTASIFIPERTEGIKYMALSLVKLGFRVWPASTFGLGIHIESLQLKSEEQNVDWESLRTYPRIFEDKMDTWLQRHEPEEDDIQELLKGIQSYLDEEGQFWLSACSVYPELHWELTLYLATKLAMGENESLTDDEQFQLQRRLFELLRLPWFRYGNIPNWLRLRLITMTKESGQHRKIRKLINNLLLTAQGNDKQETDTSRGGLKLPIAWKKISYYSKYLYKKIINTFKRTHEESPERDRVFVNYLNSGKPSILTVLIPKNVRHFFFRNGQAIFGFKPFVSLIFAALFGLSAFIIINLNKPAPDFIDAIPKFNFEKRASFEDYRGPAGISRAGLLLDLNRFSKLNNRFSSNLVENSKLYPLFLAWLKDTLSIEAAFDSTLYDFIPPTGVGFDTLNISDKLYLVNYIQEPQGSDLVLTQILTNEKPQAGDELILDLILENKGPDASDSVVVYTGLYEDVLSKSDLTFELSGIPLDSSLYGFSPLEPGEANGFSISFKLKDNNTTHLAIRSHIKSDIYDPDLSNNAIVSYLTVPSQLPVVSLIEGMEIFKSFSITQQPVSVKDTFYVGIADSITLEYTVSYFGAKKGEPINIITTLPEGTSFRSSSYQQPNFDSDKLLWNFKAKSKSDTILVRFNINVNATSAGLKLIKTDVIGDNTPSDNSVESTFFVLAPKNKINETDIDLLYSLNKGEKNNDPGLRQRNGESIDKAIKSVQCQNIAVIIEGGDKNRLEATNDIASNAAWDPDSLRLLYMENGYNTLHFSQYWGSESKDTYTIPVDPKTQSARHFIMEILLDVSDYYTSQKCCAVYNLDLELIIYISANFIKSTSKLKIYNSDGLGEAENIDYIKDVLKYLSTLPQCVKISLFVDANVSDTRIDIQSIDTYLTRGNYEITYGSDAIDNKRSVIANKIESLQPNPNNSADSNRTASNITQIAMQSTFYSEKAEPKILYIYPDGRSGVYNKITKGASEILENLLQEKLAQKISKSLWERTPSRDEYLQGLNVNYILQLNDLSLINSDKKGYIISFKFSYVSSNYTPVEIPWYNSEYRLEINDGLQPMNLDKIVYSLVEEIDFFFNSSIDPLKRRFRPRIEIGFYFRRTPADAKAIARVIDMDIFREWFTKILLDNQILNQNYIFYSEYLGGNQFPNNSVYQINGTFLISGDEDENQLRLQLRIEFPDASYDLEPIIIDTKEFSYDEELKQEIVNTILYGLDEQINYYDQ